MYFSASDPSFAILQSVCQQSRITSISLMWCAFLSHHVDLCIDDQIWYEKTYCQRMKIYQCIVLVGWINLSWSPSIRLDRFVNTCCSSKECTGGGGGGGEELVGWINLFWSPSIRLDRFVNKCCSSKECTKGGGGQIKSYFNGCGQIWFAIRVPVNDA